MNNNKLIKGLGFIALGAVASFLIITVVNGAGIDILTRHDTPMSEQRENFLAQKASIQNELIDQGDYTCCLHKPCSYCIEKDPNHGEGATCTCLEDVVTGHHPCGECMGEILEGHGNPYLSEYFPQAIADEVGLEHLETLKQIIAEKYPEVTEEDCDKPEVETCTIKEL
ncbi:MAG: hypothetical protein V1838_00620 [Patescibacteria group bacterium]